MRKHVLIWGTLLSLSTSLPAWAQEDIEEPTPPAVEDPAVIEDETGEEDTTEKFSSRERLVDTWLGISPDSEAPDLSPLEQAVSDAQTALDSAAEDISEEELASLNQALTDAQAALQAAQDEIAAGQEAASEIEALVAELTDEQVFALNRALNNTLNSPFAPELTAEQLQQIIDGDYNKHQINAFTKALEEEAKFSSLAARFEAKAEASGNDNFLMQAERMQQKAETQSARFMAKVDGVSPSEAAKNKAKENGKSVAKSAAKSLAKNQAKEASREAAKQLRKEQAKENAKEKSKGKNNA